MFSVVSFSKNRLSDTSDVEEEIQNQESVTRTNRVVSGLVKLGEKLGRPKDLGVTRSMSYQGKLNLYF